MWYFFIRGFFSKIFFFLKLYNLLFFLYNRFFFIIILQFSVPIELTVFEVFEYNSRASLFHFYLCPRSFWYRAILSFGLESYLRRFHLWSHQKTQEPLHIFYLQCSSIFWKDFRILRMQYILEMLYNSVPVFSFFKHSLFIVGSLSDIRKAVRRTAVYMHVFRILGSSMACRETAPWSRS